MVERTAAVRNRSASKRVGSGALLGGRTKPIERWSTNSPSLPDEPEKTSLPIRAFDLSRMLAGNEPLYRSRFALTRLGLLLDHRET